MSAHVLPPLTVNCKSERKVNSLPPLGFELVIIRMLAHLSNHSTKSHPHHLLFFLFPGTVDDCGLPPSPGNDCQYYPSKSAVTRSMYYFESATDTCKPISYTGCADPLPNFKNRDACEARCIRHGMNLVFFYY
jgi:hypothetical protein